MVEATGGRSLGRDLVRRWSSGRSATKKGTTAMAMTDESKVQAERGCDDGGYGKGSPSKRAAKPRSLSLGPSIDSSLSDGVIVYIALFT